MLLLPIVVIIGIFLFSPNYQVGESRSTPFGGDFLQEWVGGQIVASGNAHRLYEFDFFRAVQHDESLIGFRWPVESYYPAVYPPFYYLLVSPISGLDYHFAAIIWGLLSALALVLAGELLIRYYPPCRKYVAYGLAIAMLFTPLLTCLNIGHKSTFLLLILTGTFVLLYNKRPCWAGIVFGMIAFKPHLFLVIGLAMLVKRQWFFVLGLAITLTCFAGLCLLTGIDACVDYTGVIMGTSNYIHTGGYELANAHSLWGAVLNAFPGHSAFFVNSLTIVLSLVVLGLLAIICWGPLATESSRFALQFAALVLATILVSPHMYFYDLTMVLLPLLLIFTAKDSVPLNHGRLTIYFKSIVIVIVVGAGAFREFADLTHVQPSVFLFGVLLLNIAIGVHSMRTSGKGENSPPQIAQA